MMFLKQIIAALVISLIGGATALAETTASAQPRGAGIESKDYLWNSMDIEALELEGDVENGAKIYSAHCARCHGAAGTGSQDGSMPKIAGQHFTVVVKQLSDFLVGIRDGDVNFAALSVALKDAQQLADVAEYVAIMPRQLEAGSGPGKNLELGKKLAKQDCAGCHGQGGQGSDENFYPIISGQHFNYLYTQMRAMLLQDRRNAMPAMVAILKDYSGEELIALSDYLSRVEWPMKDEE